MVEESFKGKQADFTMFGHLPNSHNKIYEIWQLIFKKKISQSKNKLMEADKELNIKVLDFKWSPDIWQPYYIDF